MSFPSTVGDRLFEIRGKASRREFAQRYGIHEQTLIRYEKNQREPDNNFIQKVLEGEGIAKDWLVYGRGAKYATATRSSRESIEAKPGDMSPGLKGEKIQRADFIDGGKSKTSDASPISCSAEQIFILQRELLDVIRQNGDLRVEVERLRMDVERRDARIAELERQLVEALNPPGGQTVLDKRGAAAG